MLGLFGRRHFSKVVAGRQRIEAILDFWYTKQFDRKSAIPALLIKNWFMSTPELDLEIKSNFQDDLKLLSDGQYDSWLNDHEGRLAAILLAD